MLAKLAITSLAWPFTQQKPDAVGTPGFCIPTTGPFAVTLSIYFDDVRGAGGYNSTGRTTQFLRRDRTLQVERVDIVSTSLRPRFERYDVTQLRNYKQNAEWIISRDESGKITCSKGQQPPGPQPTGADCIANVTAVSRGT